MNTSHDFGPWLFYGGALSLDFVNTLRDRATAPRETLSCPEALAAWAAEAGLLAAETWSSGTAAAAVQDAYLQALDLREAIDAVLNAGVSPVNPDDVHRVNRWALLASQPQLATSNPVSLREQPRSPAEALGTIAADAIAIVTRGQRDRVKICAHERCGLRYLDRSRAGQRQWCSMQRCGNRTKVARHAARHDA